MNHQAFPVPALQKSNGVVIDGTGAPGMTYRQWLVGQVAKGVAEQLVHTPKSPLDLDELALSVVGLVDRMLHHLSGE